MPPHLVAGLLVLAVVLARNVVASTWNVELRTAPYRITQEAWNGFYFKFPSNAVVVGVRFSHGPHVHHCDLNCCAGFAPREASKTAVPLLSDYKSQRLVASPDFGNCAGHYEALVWTSPQAPGFEFPPGTGIAVGPGTICELGFLQVHWREPSPDVDDTTGVDITFLDGGETATITRYMQVIYYYIGGFVLPPHSPRYVVSQRFKYRGTEVAHAFKTKLHTHYAGRTMSLTRLRCGTRAGLPDEDQCEQALCFSGNPASQEWMDMNMELLPGDRLILECEYSTLDKTEAMHDGNSASNEMCWQYVQVTTESSVSRRLLNDLRYDGPVVSGVPGHVRGGSSEHDRGFDFSSGCGPTRDIVRLSDGSLVTADTGHTEHRAPNGDSGEAPQPSMPRRGPPPSTSPAQLPSARDTPVRRGSHYAPIVMLGVAILLSLPIVACCVFRCCPAAYARIAHTEDEGDELSSDSSFEDDGEQVELSVGAFDVDDELTEEQHKLRPGDDDATEISLR